MSDVGIVVGNPKTQSRTLSLAEDIAAAAADAAGLEGAETLTVNLADFGPQLFEWSSARVKEAVEGSVPAHWSWWRHPRTKPATRAS